jgi:TusE/DsrC/DsvC family sulfur relay protein
MEKTMAGINVELSDDGYLKNFGQWNKEVAQALASEEGISLTDEHWKVLDYIQHQYKTDTPLTIRSVGKSGVVDIKGFYALFPDGPLKKASRIAGIPKPVSCI